MNPRLRALAIHPSSRMTAPQYRAWASILSDEGHSFAVEADAISGLAEVHRRNIALRDHYTRRAGLLRMLAAECDESAREQADLAGDIEGQPTDTGSAETAVIVFVLVLSAVFLALAAVLGWA